MTLQRGDRLANLPKAWIVKKREVAEDLFTIWLRPEVPFTFKPGQYITIGTGGIERPYSIASAPYEETIELFIEHVLPENGGKLTPLLWAQHFFRWLKTELSVEVSMPNGGKEVCRYFSSIYDESTFYLRDSLNRLRSMLTVHVDDAGIGGESLFSPRSLPRPRSVSAR